MEEEKDFRLEEQKKFLISFSYWGIIILSIVILVKLTSSILTPFITAFLISCILNYPIKLISTKLHFNRAIVSIVCVILFYALGSFIIILVGARIFLFIKDIFSTLPDLYSATFAPMIQETFDNLENITSSLDPALISVFDESSDTILSTLGNFISKISTSVVGAVSNVAASIPGIFFRILITVIVTFFFTISFEEITSFLGRQIPAKIKKTLEESKNYVSTTLLKCVGSYIIILSMTFAEIFIGLTILGIENSMIIAFFIAIFDILPILGTGGIMIPWSIIAFLSGNYTMGFGIAILYLIVTVIRNIVEPKLVGYQVGLHPVVTLASMLIGLNLFGIIGLFGFPITLSLLKNLNDKGVIHIFK